jgi:pimeloyl-ACP methyl ester carboxylesterase
LDELAKDVIGLIDAAGQEQVYLVGHDWGAAVTWWTALKYPHRLKKIAILNVPHLSVMQRTLRSSWAQLRKSWYIFFFQLPWLPEAFTRANNWKNGVAALRGSSRPGTFREADLAQYRAAWSQPGAITGMINWYRALLRSQPQPIASPRVKVPTLLIWGAQDLFLSREMAQPSIDLCDQGQLVWLEEATHWVQHEEATRVNQLLIEFLKP